MPARLLGRREGGGTVEVLLLQPVISEFGEEQSVTTFECLVKPGRKVGVGARLTFGGGELTAIVAGVTESGNRIIEFSYGGVFDEMLERLGKTPLPPYIREELDDAERYQTVYSNVSGSAAAPTAGLHFTTELIEELRLRGVEICFVTLHVGLGTFRPVKTEKIKSHKMHSEYFIIPGETADTVNRVKTNGGRVFAVGTTSCRVLESNAEEKGMVRAYSGFTDIFIYPGYRYRCIDGLITNFHLPESTLIMLVSAFAGRENVLRAYDEAIRERYRFYSFGDAMLIL
jgi:S-adenosylmethionine:tRNA ribosyltransferase-isomerase